MASSSNRSNATVHGSCLPTMFGSATTREHDVHAVISPSNEEPRSGGPHVANRATDCKPDVIVSEGRRTVPNVCSMRDLTREQLLPRRRQSFGAPPPPKNGDRNATADSVGDVHQLTRQLRMADVFAQVRQGVQQRPGGGDGFIRKRS
jgi:hypothetical protein